MEKLSKWLGYLLLACLGWVTFLIAYFVIPAKVMYQVQETYTFEIPQDQTASLSLYTMLPMTGPGQFINQVDVEWQGEYSLEEQVRQPDHPGVIVVSFHQPAGTGTVQASIYYRVELRSGRINWKGPVSPRYLKPSPGIESDHLEIQALAGQFDGQDQSLYPVYRLAARSLNWPVGNRIGAYASALEALNRGIGGCNEFSNVLVAFFRASGTPAYTISGLAFPQMMIPFYTYQSVWNHPAGAHAWTAFSSESGWSYSDPSFANRLPDFLYFQRNDGNHLAYTDQDSKLEVYQEMLRCVEDDSQLIAAMSAPLKFAAGADVESVRLTPEAKVRIFWDGRLFNALACVLLLSLAVRLVENKRWSRKEQKTDQPTESKRPE